ncbi:sn-glycerol-3-phosphate ABC transporter ATP-binding protein UgpC [Marinomonas sp. M1K-6]|uniref:sn-glycerol-3-phosphate ABC transporter ATP-binding protein UgpC n=1 Tax=Marinomonas profundi TaxID=2726122 RepID=A0A847R4M8_9GAMM|nr:sn-glycerol-3-phosphate ABC transporter ATP-binding protein UgpC [Marinomonas profundi]NLQ18952.1 sn-glycerol-3-phosphate ABC transporter ATP-binding protein UgpC [Marinomonas profundi]UDV02309.1 sn-glycerol-3-phosphate ABC transporter ATP-binding protein UgpC [Marinomonas profundi]
MSYLTITDLQKHYDNYHALRGINLTITEGEFVVFVGPSGCGKSTLLRTIAGLESSTGGSIDLDGREITELASSKRDLAMVFQSYALYPHMTVADNLSFALRLAKVSDAEIKEKVRSVSASLQLDELLERKPKELSGGQRQRVAIGRAIVRQPKVFLFDEPLSNLDAALRVQMRLELARLHKKLGTTMIYVTHDQVEAMTLADRVVILNAGQIEQVGTPLELYRQPNNRFVAEFIGTPKMNLIKANKIVRQEDNFAIDLLGQSILFPANRLKGPLPESVIVGIRPEHMTLVKDGGDLTGRIELVEHLGSEAYAHLQLSNDQTIIIKAPARTELKDGQEVSIQIDTSEVILFNENDRVISVIPEEA